MLALRCQLVVLAPLVLAAPSWAGIVHVQKGAAGARDGTSWPAAFDELRDALAVTQPGDEVWVAEGTYTPLDANSSFVVNAIAVYGGFRGDETAREQRNWGLHRVILSGDVEGDDVGFGDEDNCHHVVLVTNGPARLDGLVIRNGWARGEGPESFGGGVYVTALGTSASLRLENCELRRNRARRGGALCTATCNIEMYSCLVANNDAQGVPGSPQIDGCAGTYVAAAVGGFTSTAHVTYAFNTQSNADDGVVTTSTHYTPFQSIRYGNTFPYIVFFPEVGIHDICVDPSSPYSGSDWVLADPQFVSVPDENYNLRVTSPVLGQGFVSAGSGVTRDLNGLPRNFRAPTLPPYAFPTICDFGAYQYAPDCDSSGFADANEIQAGLLTDANQNLFPDACEAIGIFLCPGDGSGGTCPCGNFGAPGRGCQNSNGTGGGRLRALGTASASADSVRFEVDGLDDTASALFFQGNGLDLVGNVWGLPFGDGLRCAFGQTIRLRTKGCVGGACAMGAGVAGDPRVSVLGAPVVPGARYYQAWYRDTAPFCTPSAFNVTNTLQIAWSP